MISSRRVSTLDDLPEMTLASFRTFYGGHVGIPTPRFEFALFDRATWPLLRDTQQQLCREEGIPGRYLPVRAPGFAWSKMIHTEDHWGWYRLLDEPQVAQQAS